MLAAPRGSPSPTPSWWSIVSRARPGEPGGQRDPTQLAERRRPPLWHPESLRRARSPSTYASGTPHRSRSFPVPGPSPARDGGNFFNEAWPLYAEGKDVGVASTAVSLRRGPHLRYAEGYYADGPARPSAPLIPRWQLIRRRANALSREALTPRARRQRPLSAYAEGNLACADGSQPLVYPCAPVVELGREKISRDHEQH